jgi:hypothetical protein
LTPGRALCQGLSRSWFSNRVKRPLGVIADISLVNNYRSQFNRILTKSSFDDLLKQLREKDSKDRG